MYIAHPGFLKGGLDQNNNLVKSVSVEEKVKNRRTCCDKFCIRYQEVKGLFRKTLLNRKAWENTLEQLRDLVTSKENCKNVAKN